MATEKALLYSASLCICGSVSGVYLIRAVARAQGGRTSTIDTAADLVDTVFGPFAFGTGNANRCGPADANSNLTLKPLAI